jgi:FkbM family methyltransferase
VVQENINMVKTNIIANNLTSRVTVFPFGLGSTKDSFLIWREKNNYGNNIVGHLDFTDDENKFVVSSGFTLPMDELPALAQTHVRLMKLDVQGHELDVLRGGKSLFFEKLGVDVIAFELAPFLMNSDAEPTKALDLLLLMQNMGYELYHNVDELGRVLPNTKLTAEQVQTYGRNRDRNFWDFVAVKKA